MADKYTRIAIVTGTTSGIGEATARRFVAEGFGVVENLLLEVAEGVAVAVVAQAEELFFADALIPADGRVDVQSEETSDHRCGLQACEGLELRVDGLRAIEAELE